MLSGQNLRCEYLVVGSGAGGSVAAALLAEAGRDVLMVEEGGWPPENASPSNIGDLTALLYRNRGVFPLLGSPTIPLGEARCVGGGTAINGALLWRTPAWILDEWRTVHGLTGYGADSLAKHFDTIESDLHVTRHTLEEDANLDSLNLFRGAERLGWKASTVPRAVTHCSNVSLCPVGCPPCGKQATTKNYIPRALNMGAGLLANCRVRKIIHANGVARRVIAEVAGPCETSLIEIEFDHLVLACGAIQTPHLLRRSKVSSTAGRKLEFHMNLKTVALFRQPVYAERGTILTVQVQEFRRQGVVIMPSCLQPHYLVTTVAHHGTDAINHVFDHYDHAAVYVTMLRQKTRGHVVSAFGEQPIVWYRFDRRDMDLIMEALRRTAEVLFASGAVELFLPIGGSGAVTSPRDVEEKLSNLTPKQLEILTVHIMASCPMGPNAENSVVRPDGRLWNMKNVFLADASILPSNIGESPQGTIMAFAHEVIGRHLAD